MHRRDEAPEETGNGSRIGAAALAILRAPGFRRGRRAMAWRSFRRLQDD
jgi:hypothetical protein